MRIIKLTLISLILTVACVRTAGAENQDSSVGINVHSITWECPYSYICDEIVATADIKIGERYDSKEVLTRLEAIKQRNIFKNVLLEEEIANNGVNLNIKLEPKPIVVGVKFEGVSHFSVQELRRKVFLTEGDELDVLVLEKSLIALKALYKLAAFNHVNITYDINDLKNDSWKKQIKFMVEEGEQAKISEVTFAQELDEDALNIAEEVIKTYKDAAASDSQKKRLVQQLLVAFRKAGYLQASARINKEMLDLQDNLALEISVNLRAPIKIEFTGNSSLEESDLIALLNLETRKIPFVPTAITSYAKEIESLYQKKGYYFVTAKTREIDSENSSKVFQIEINEGKKYELGMIGFEGNEQIKSSKLKNLIAIKPASVFPISIWRKGYLYTERINTALDNISNYYRRKGFLDSQVSYRVEKNDKDDALKLIFIISEGQVRRVNSSEIRWKSIAEIHSLEDSEVFENLFLLMPGIEKGEVFSVERIRAEQIRISQLVQSFGYPNSQVTVNANTQTGEIVFSVDLGRKIETGNLIIQGNRVTKDDVILRHVKHLSHIKWDLEKIAAAQTRLLKTGLFKTVEIKETAETSSNAVKDLAVQLKERETGELDFLIGYDTEDGVHLASELAQRNYHGSGNTLAFGVDGFVRSGNQVLDAGRARALYSIKGFLDSQNDLDNELFAQFAVKLVDQFSYDRVGLASNIKSEILDQSIFTTGVSVYRENLFDVEQDVQLGEHDVGDSFYSLLSANIDLDKRDDVFNPRSGYRTQFGVDLSSSIFGSEANFYNFDVQHGFYFPVSSILTLGNNIHFQLVRPFGGDSVVPLSRRLFLGGRNSLRGYSRHSVGPMGDLGNVVGGDTAINYSLELQLSVTENVATLVFMDIGQNILKEKGTFTGDALDFNSFKYTPGIGLRYKTPIGPISAEYGFVLNRKDSDPSGQFHIAIGASF